MHQWTEKWTSLTDCTNKVWYFDWSQNPNTIWVELKNLNFDKGQPVRVIDPRNPSLTGEVSRAFEPVK
jgi:penicillin V acylase-like amidase (Ntn superfamily)